MGLVAKSGASEPRRRISGTNESFSGISSIKPEGELTPSSVELPSNHAMLPLDASDGGGAGGGRQSSKAYASAQSVDERKAQAAGRDEAMRAAAGAPTEMLSSKSTVRLITQTSEEYSIGGRRSLGAGSSGGSRAAIVTSPYHHHLRDRGGFVSSGRTSPNITAQMPGVITPLLPSVSLAPSLSTSACLRGRRLWTICVAPAICATA